MNHPLTLFARGTEEPEENNFFPGRETTPGEKAPAASRQDDESHASTEFVHQ